LTRVTRAERWVKEYAMGVLRRLFGGADDSGPLLPEAFRDEARKLGRTLDDIFTQIEPALVAGTRTSDINALVEAQLSERGVTSFFQELDFPASCTTSIDAEVINVPPSSRRLEAGQLLKLQIGVKGKKTYAMQAWTYPIGSCSDEDRRLMTAGVEALRMAVSAVRSGHRAGEVSAAIQKRLEADGFSPARQFTGHGVGARPHVDPQIPGVGAPSSGPKLRAGAILSLDVIAHAGDPRCNIEDDLWTTVAVDGRRSVHFGQMVIVGEGRPEILTSEREIRNAS
jgi:methionyl aminopeptidase